MSIPIMLQLECLLRLLVASLCGIAIGLERETHLKTAGIRTHLIVSLASAIMVIVSKYGFFDVLAMDNAIKLDPSRVAAGAVTAVGFLGAGVIFVRKQSISGLTTSAGIWATVGVGTAIGAGMYLIGAVAAVMIILVHVIFHKNSRLTKEATSEQITLQVGIDEDTDKLFDSIFDQRHIQIITIRAKKINKGLLELRLLVRYPETFRERDIIQLLKDVPAIISIEI